MEKKRGALKAKTSTLNNECKLKRIIPLSSQNGSVGFMTVNKQN